MGRRQKGLNFNRRRRSLELENLQDNIRFAISIVIAILIAGFIVFSWGIKTNVIGPGMEPAFYSGQTVYLSKLSYLFKKPKAGDVVAFLPNGNENTHLYIKRVVAVPGDSVQIIDGRLYINYEEYSGSVDYDKIADPGMAEEEILLEADQYFVLGDNINTSEDSRSGNIGPISKRNIEGKVWFRLTQNDSRFGIVRRKR